MENRRIDLKHRLNRESFLRIMQTLAEHKLLLTEYDSRLFRKLQDAWDTVGSDMTLTVKQYNHIKLVAFDLEKGA